MTGAATAVDQAPPAVWETRFVKAEKADLILPFVSDALKTAGGGSVCVVKNGTDVGGLQITVPQDLAVLLVAAIGKLNELNNLEEYTPHNVYETILLDSIADATIWAILDELKLLPPDMRATRLQVDATRFALVISGPPDRLGFYTGTVRANLTSLLAVVAPLKFYAPLLEATVDKTTLMKAIDALELLPPDMRVSLVDVAGDRFAIAISGPSGRYDAYKTDVLPSLASLIRSFETPGFPGP